MENKRIYQVAKDFHVSSEALVSMLKEQDYHIKSHMSIVDDKMLKSINDQFAKQHDKAVKDIQKKKKISEAIDKSTDKNVKNVKKDDSRRPPQHSKRPGHHPKPNKDKNIAEDKRDIPVKKPVKPRNDNPPKKVKSFEKKSRSKFRKQKVKEHQAAVQDSFKKTMASLSTLSNTKTKKSRPKPGAVTSGVEEVQVVKVSEFVSVSELASQMGIPANELIGKCIELGMMVSINQRLDMEAIVLLSDEYGYEVEQIGEYAEDLLKARDLEQINEEDLIPRPPVVTVMGHVDHGKTSLLDNIRKSNVVSGESGGITQHIGAYSVKIPSGKSITFIDTPGHEAFTAMRARGAKVTDIVIIVIAADDSVMPQTIEAIDHAKAGGVPLIIAINKIDLPNADVEKIKSDLSRKNILVEDWGGEYQCQEISAKNDINIDKLLEKVLLEAEMLELKSDPTIKASGVVIDSQLDKGRGPVATILVQSGSLYVGDSFIAGMITGRVRAMFDDHGTPVESAGPSQPVQIFGMDGVPKAGDTFFMIESESEARVIAQQRRAMKREQDFRRIKRITLSDIYDKIKDGLVKELNLIIKADVDGSMEALSDTLSSITHDEVRVRVILQGVGGINENDVLLAAASDAIIIGFHVRPKASAKALAEKENVEIKLYNVIYEAIEDVEKALSGLLTPGQTIKTVGTAVVRDVFKIPKIGNIAGCYVTSGIMKRNAKAKLIRDDIEIYSSSISSLKRFKEDTTEVSQGYECGLSIEGYDDIKVGDVVEIVEIIEVARKI